ncbi:WhiB family transcriptional regulator [Mycobacterium sp. M26]|uniref:WhiB family transcriptional regulator n=1 Tax=Mycobacterium sp. M26 TaxID=1762962 RepID=UPI00073F30D8|nr:WhiB family transcriptional regulator [Mycobacterium sp. M26]
MRRQRFPRPAVEEWDWQRRGVCRAADSSVFFGPDGETRAARVRRERAAKTLCHGCPVIAECRRHALNAGEPYGIWGGLSAAERERLLRPQRRVLDSSRSIAL